MIRFLADDDVDPLEPQSRMADLASLLSLLSGRELGQTAAKIEALRTRLESMFGKSLDAAVRLSHEQLNELLLSVEESRVSRAFYDGVILGRTFGESPKADVISLEDLKRGVSRFRGFAMLAFGNYRFAFRKLSALERNSDVAQALWPWSQPTPEKKGSYKARPSSLAGIRDGETKIPADKTWHLGYLSVQAASNDLALAYAIQAKADGNDVAWLVENLKSSGKEHLAPLAEKYVVPDDLVNRWRKKISTVVKDLEDLLGEMTSSTDLGEENTRRYLTWDYMDVYVATSMRHVWEFRETFDLVESVFVKSELKRLRLRWFDPTQSYETAVRDKGLVEALMLKRASCTLYMVQESDTLGKDSELAATLAQGKPVIAYLRNVTEQETLKAFAQELLLRPIAYFKRRMHLLESDGFFADQKFLSEASELMDSIGETASAQDIADWATRFLQVLEEVEANRTFQAYGEEEIELQHRLQKLSPGFETIVAALEAVALNKRATTLRSSHPLSMQVHLESGVSNGVLVTRTATECGQLIEELLTNDLRFRIEAQYHSRTKERIGTQLIEDRTESVFRYVTGNPLLTNSFWNFYLREPRKGV